MDTNSDVSSGHLKKTLFDSFELGCRDGVPHFLGEVVDDFLFFSDYHIRYFLCCSEVCIVLGVCLIFFYLCCLITRILFFIDIKFLYCECFSHVDVAYLTFVQKHFILKLSDDVEFSLFWWYVGVGEQGCVR